MKHWKERLLSRKTGAAEWAVLAVYTIYLIIITRFHEFHFDELQAWQIAKSASYHDMLFYVPHYEGHPPLWHLLLSVFAKTGCDLRVALPAVNILICAAAMWVLLFRSPFPRIVRCLLPFSYFLSYQYGTLSRPYSLMMLAFFLAAAAYTKRNVHPWRYILALMLLCLTSAYGIMAAGGLCLAWTVEILRELLKTRKFPEFFRSARFFSLLSILALAVGLFLLIRPADDCYFGGLLDSSGPLERLLNPRIYLRWLAFPFDTWFGNQISSDEVYSSATGIIMEAIFSVPLLGYACLLLHKNRKLLEFLLPYLIITWFMVLRYFSAYHLGVIALLFVFAAWILCAEPFVMPKLLRKPPELSPSIRKLLLAGAALCCCTPFFYTIAASVNEIRLEFAPGAHYAAFIRENHLENAKIMAPWYVSFDTSEEEEAAVQFFMGSHRIPNQHPPVKYSLTSINAVSLCTTACLGWNPVMNFNAECPDDLYMHYRWKEDVQANYALWRTQGLPDFLFGWLPIDEVYSEEELEGVRYVLIDEFPTYTLFKNGHVMANNQVFIREDLLDEYPQFTVIP